MANPRLLFLFSDTGGGHRSAAEAVIEAIRHIAGDAVDISLVDFFKQYSPPPFNRMPELYPRFVERPRGWGLGYRVSDGTRRVRSISRLAWPYVRRSIHRILENHPADLIVSFHGVVNDPVARSLQRIPPAERPPFVVVVTDLVTVHAFWYHRQADLTIVPTQPAFDRGLQNGLRPEQLRVMGLPVADRFCHPSEGRGALRERFGWPADRKMVLIVGGGDGMGPLGETAEAIDAAGLPVGLAVVAGRNAALKERLERRAWDLPVFVYGFVRDMPELMQAADVLVTKAGPGTLSEAFNTGLPAIVYTYLPGQETGNIPYLTENGAGIWAPSPQEVVSGLRCWLDDPAAYQAAVDAARRLGRPEAAREIARLLLRMAGGSAAAFSMS